MLDACFYKSKKWRPHKNAQCYSKIEREKYNKKYLDKAAAEVISILGEKDKYTVADAVKFYQTKYHAFQVPWKNMLQYLDGKIITTFYESSCFYDDEIAPFDYTGNKDHKNVTLIIDLINNKDLRDRYPIIGQLENEYKEMQAQFGNVIEYKNDFIVIGSFDGEMIESMFTYSQIDDVNYEMLYFYLHS